MKKLNDALSNIQRVLNLLKNVVSYKTKIKIDRA